MLQALRDARIAKDSIKMAKISIHSLLDIMDIRGPEIPLQSFARLLERLRLTGFNKLHLTELYASMRASNELHANVNDLI